MFMINLFIGQLKREGSPCFHSIGC
eukprot:UN03567